MSLFWQILLNSTANVVRESSHLKSSPWIILYLQIVSVSKNVLFTESDNNYLRVILKFIALAAHYYLDPIIQAQYFTIFEKKNYI